MSVSNQSAMLTVAAPGTAQDEVLATVSTGTGTAQQAVNLSSVKPIVGTYVPVSASGIGTNPLTLYNWNPATQLQNFLAAQVAGTASIVGIGDSWTAGFGSAATGWTRLSYLSEMTQALNQDGIAAQSDNFLGSEFYISNGLVDDNRLTPVGYPTTNTFYDGGWAIVGGGNAIALKGDGKGFSFQLDTPGTYNEITLSYIDLGSGSVSLMANGNIVGSMSFGNTGQMLTQTIKVPAASYSDLVVKSSSANPVYIQGASFSSSTNPAIQVYNAGIGGWDSNAADTSIYMGQALKGSSNGYGQTAGAAALKPSLAIVDLGTNDIALAEDTTTQTLANIEQIVATLRAAGSDVIVVIPQPFGSSAYATQLPALRAGLQTYSLANNVPLIDLSSTYNNSEAALEAAGLKSDSLHGNATFYADIGSELASLLDKTIKNASTSPVVVPPPSAPLLTASSDSGVVGDGITNVMRPTLTGTAAAGDVVKLYDTAGLLGSATASSSGAWSVTVAQALTAGTYSLYATATNASGTVSAKSASVSLTIDTQAPSAPSALALAAASGDGVVGQTQLATPTITGMAAAGDTVSLYDNGTLVGTAPASASGTWSITPATPLALGAQGFTATATDVAGNVSAASPVLAVSVVSPPRGNDTLSLNVGKAAIGGSGQNPQFTVSVDGTQFGGVQTVIGSETAGGDQTINLTGDFGATGSHTVAVTYLNGFTGSVANWGGMLFINAASIDGVATFPDTQTGYSGTSDYTLQKPATLVPPNAGTQDTLILNLSEAAVGGKDALFMVSVDGQLNGGIRSVTASKAASQSQNVTVTGNFGAGAHVVAIDFLNGFTGNAADAGRTLYVNAITLDGYTTTENTSTGYNGAVSYTVKSG